MEGLKKIGWFFGYWVAVLGGSLAMLILAKFAVYRTLIGATTFREDTMFSTLIITGIIVYALFEKYVNKPKLDN